MSSIIDVVGKVMELLANENHPIGLKQLPNTDKVFVLTTRKGYGDAKNYLVALDSVVVELED